MKPFMDKDFLLSTDTAKRLFHEVAQTLPIIDYHCHLSPREIAEDQRYENITQLFLGGDHYKWRAMNAMGVPDTLTRGDGDDYEKFLAYARTVSMAIGNPLHHWTHLELQRVFGIYEPLNERTAPDIWTRANEMLNSGAISARSLIRKFHVEVICTTDDPIDSLAYHKAIAADASFPVRVLPAFRPDKAINVDRVGYAEYIRQLADVSHVEIACTKDVIKALEARIAYFAECGACVADHGLETVPYEHVDMDIADKAVRKALAGKTPSPEQTDHYRTAVLVALGKIYAERGWVQQYHMNALRNNNSRKFGQFGPDTGYDSISDDLIAHKLSKLMNAQDKHGNLPKTILYSLNPAANATIAAMAGNFQEGGVPGKIQMGSAWWFCDQEEGMREQMKTLAAIGVLSQFVGMLTDSRSFTSYPRHEYFRRILCDLLGQWVENGEYPDDFETLAKIVRGICYENAKRYFGF